ncbi:hypothetical protein [Anaerobaca lacustris]|uniref:RiboL-PSP-HEPN domain-containing protein n=1 Tax=Anaerobaca lacustris TaxID=3044600 RepID=A0AAW6U6G3_9BACT|nr:hypothetical protein [Sedimentisphaerales bacterium M17dextr]
MCDITISLSLDQLGKYDQGVQTEVMRKWFFEHFEDPVHRTPYESREGGYQWIWGGPYDAREQLEEQFAGYVSEEVIDRVANELERECLEWAPVESPGDYEDYYLDDVAAIENCYEQFTSAISDVRRLLSVDIPKETAGKFYCLLFVNVITALETYLSDKFIKRVMNDREALRKFVESASHFGSEKIPLSQVLKAAETIEVKVGSHLADIVWHNLGRIKSMYKATLNADLGNIGPMMKAITKRHHLVHRNGQDKDGNAIDVTPEDIHSIICLVESLVGDIEKQLKEPF